MKAILYIFLSAILLASCSNETLSDDSVVDSYRSRHEETELDRWIAENITKPYNISVVYRWDRNAAQAGSYTYPPQSEKVGAVLETMKYLWLETYTLQSVGGAEFMKGKVPVRIYMYGGKNLDGNGVELICNADAAATEMHIYNVNEFDPTDRDKVYVLIRSVHHQFAKRLMELFPYDRDAFMSISRQRYTFTTDPIAAAMQSVTSRRRLFELTAYAAGNGFFTFHSFLSPADDFAEIISSLITNKATEIAKAENDARTPMEFDDSEDEYRKQQYIAEAEKAYKELTQKKAFVEEYFAKNVGIKLNRLQLVSLRRIDDFVNNKTKKD